MSEKTVRIEVEVSATDKTGSTLTSIGNKFKKSLSGFDEQTKKTEKTLTNWTKQKYQVLLEAKDKVGPILSGIGSNLKSFAGKTWSTTLKLVDMATAPLQGIMNLLANPIIQAGAVLGISLNAADVINTYKDFESQMSQVKAISGADGAAYERLNAKAQEMGKTTKFTATEAAQGFNYMAMAGWNTDQMEKGISGILSLAAASGEDLGTTSDIVTDALTAFNMGADDATHFADVLAVASSNANTNVAMMGETFKYVGAASGALGYSIEDVALGIGLMANAGIKSSQAGTELNSIFTRLSTNTSGARDAIEALGISFYDQNGNARDFGKVLEDLRTATKDMNNEQKINLANTIAGQRAQAGLLAMLNASETDYRKVTSAIQDADGAAERMSDTMMDNLAGAITKLQSAWDGLKVKLGERIAPYLREFAEWLTEQAPKIESVIQNVMDKVDQFAQKMKGRWKDLTGSQEWADADFLGKIKLSWDKMIMEPLSEWWNGTGKAKVAHFAGEFGNFLGSALNMGILGLFGFDTGGAIDEGASIGKSFAKGFADGFDFKAVASKVMHGIGNVFKSALKLLPGGSAPGVSSLISAALIGKGIATVASPLLSLGKAGVGVGRLAKTVFGQGSSTLVQNSDGTFTSVASGGLGLGSKIGSGLMSLGGKAYGLLSGGSGALSGTAAGAAGLSAVAGGAIAAGTVISGGMDVYKAIKADDEKARATYSKSAGWKFGGVAAGAAGGAIAGAAMGSAVPVVGTLIGAGIGGIAGLIMGNREKKKYEEEMERLSIRREKTAEAYKLTGVALDKVTFKTKEMNEALENSEMSAEEFAYLLQNDMKSAGDKAFGSIKLSLGEVKKLATQITFGKMQTEFENFNAAVKKTDTAYAALADAQYNMKEMTWKVGLGMELSGDDIDSFKSSVDTFVNSAMDYVDKSGYEASLGMKLIMGSEADTSVIDNYYRGVKKKIEDLQSELNNRIEIALQGDYRIDADEAKAIEEIQNQITDITNKIANAQQDAQLEAIKIKYSGAELDYESFTMLQEELTKFKQEAESSLETAYISARTSLQLALDDADTEEERNRIQEQINQLDSGYALQLQELDVRVGTFQLETVATAWEEQLKVAFAGMEGSVQENLSEILKRALAIKPDVTAWTQEDIVSWFGLDKIGDASVAGNIAAEIQAIASQVSSQSKETISAEMKNIMPTSEELMQAMNFDFSSFENAGGIFEKVSTGVKNLLGDGIVNTINNADFSESFSGLNLAQKYSDAIKEQDIAGGIREALNQDLSEAQLFDTLSSVMQAQAEGVNVTEFIEPLKLKFEEAGTDIPQRLQEALNSNFENVNLFETLGEVMIAQSEGIEVGQYLEPLLAKFSEAEINLSAFVESLSGQIQTQFNDALANIDLSGSGETLQANIQTTFANIGELDPSGMSESVKSAIGTGLVSGVGAADYNGAMAPLGENVTSAGAMAIVNADNSPISGAAAAKMGQWTGIVQSQASAGINTTMPIRVTANWSLINPAHTFTVSGDGGGSASISVSAHAAGGYVSGGPQLSWLAEEGWGEYIIPTNPTRRADALRLYEDAGKALGIKNKEISAHAAGGYVSGYRDKQSNHYYNNAREIYTNISEQSQMSGIKNHDTISSNGLLKLSEYSESVKAYERLVQNSNTLSAETLENLNSSELNKISDARDNIKDISYSKETSETNKFFTDIYKARPELVSEVSANSKDGEGFTPLASEPIYSASLTEGSREQGATNISVNINMTPEININGAANPGEIGAEIKASILGYADDMAARLAENLEKSFGNMPRKRA